jgi:hypothetical protein
VKDGAFWHGRVTWLGVERLALSVVHVNGRGTRRLFRRPAGDPFEEASSRARRSILARRLGGSAAITSSSFMAFYTM